MKTVVILGGGIGGLVAANELRRRLPREHKVVLVEKNSEHAFPPSFLWLMTGRRQPNQIIRTVRSLVRSGVEVIQAEVKSIDIPNRSVVTSSELTLVYDHLVIALGAELSPDSIPGLYQNYHSFYTFQETIRLQQALARFTGGKIAIVICSLPYKCPAAPHEAAMLMVDYFRRRGIGNHTQVHLYTPEPQPMPAAGPQIGEAVKSMLSSNGISFHPLHKLTSVNSQQHKLFFDGREAVSYDLLVAIPPHRAPSVVRDANLTNEAGWIPVDPTTLKTKFDNVYAIGDITSIPIPGRWKPDIPLMLPKAGVFAEMQAKIVAQEIEDEINGRPHTAGFGGKGFCILEAGRGFAGLAFGDFFAVPSPKVELHNPRRSWHIGKVLFEKWWLSSFGLKKSILQMSLKIGSKLLKVPIDL